MTKVITLRKRKKSYSIAEKTRQKQRSNIVIEKNRIFLLIISIISILLGAVTYRFFPNENIIESLNNTLEIFKTENFINIFLCFIKADLIYFLMAFFIGTSFMGAVLSPLPLVLKCFFIGFQSGYLYNDFELKGVLFCLILLYPCYVITTSSLIFACDESIYMSKYLFSTITNKNTANDISVKLYLLRYLILIVINTVCIAVNSAIICFIAPKINLL